MARRFTAIMALLYALICVCYKIPIAYTLASVLGIIVLGILFSLSFKIVLTENRIKFFQFFIKIADIELKDIQDIYYTAWNNNGQDCALIILCNNKKEYTFPVRIYGKKQIDKLISYIRKHLKISTKHLPKKTQKTLNLYKFLLVILATIIIIKAVEFLIY